MKEEPLLLVCAVLGRARVFPTCSGHLAPRICWDSWSFWGESVFLKTPDGLSGLSAELWRRSAPLKPSQLYCSQLDTLLGRKKMKNKHPICVLRNSRTYRCGTAGFRDEKHLAFARHCLLLAALATSPWVWRDFKHDTSSRHLKHDSIIRLTLLHACTHPSETLGRSGETIQKKSSNKSPKILFRS